MKPTPAHIVRYNSQRTGFSPINLGAAPKGFTLIEVLIALTLLSIMIVLLFTSLKICADSWEKGENKITAVNEIAVVYKFFQDHVATAKPLFNTTATGEKNFSFQGNSKSMQFVSAFPASAGKMGLQLFSVTLLEEDNDQFINVALVPFINLAEDEKPSKEEVTLIKHVSEFNLSYFGSEDEMTEGVWSKEWLNKTILPNLVKINILLTNGYFWPEMIFDIKVSGTIENNNAIGISGNIDDPEAVQ
jgi:general secretion pathway protein J